MTARDRLIRALRDAVDAYEAMTVGKARTPRLRGPIVPQGPEPTDEIRAKVIAHLRRGAY
jgi:hypothetical protein